MFKGEKNNIDISKTLITKIPFVSFHRMCTYRTITNVARKNHICGFLMKEYRAACDERSCVFKYSHRVLNKISSCIFLYGGSTQITTAGPTTVRVRAIDWHSVETRVSLLSPSCFYEKGEARALIDPAYANNPSNECHSLINEFHIGSLVCQASFLLVSRITSLPPYSFSTTSSTISSIRKKTRADWNNKRIRTKRRK